MVQTGWHSLTLFSCGSCWSLRQTCTKYLDCILCNDSLYRSYSLSFNLWRNTRASSLVAINRLLFLCVRINTAILLACIYKEARAAHRLYAYKILMRNELYINSNELINIKKEKDQIFLFSCSLSSISYFFTENL